MASNLVTQDQFLKRTGMARSSLWLIRTRGEFVEPVVAGGGFCLFKADDLVRWAAQHLGMRISFTQDRGAPLGIKNISN